MKSKIFIGLAIAMLTAAANADYSVTWGAGEGFWKNGDSLTGFLDVSINPNQTALAQLIYSPDAIASPATLGNAGFTTGGETVLASYTITVPGSSSTYGDGWLENFSGTFTAGSLYARVFEYNAPSVVGGTLYYDSPIIEAIDLGALATPQNIEFNLTPQILDGDELVLSVAVPEPGSIAFILFGGLLLAIRRKIKK